MKTTSAMIVLLCSVAAATARAQTPLNGVGFLIGHWAAGRGQVAQTGGTSCGSSTITTEVGGKALLRRDHTDLFDKAGAPAGSFDQIMLIYPEAGTLHAEYTDGQHVIHYTKASVTPGQSVSFTSASSPHAPTFQLSYTLFSPKTLGVAFAIELPGEAVFRPIATGTLSRAD